MPRVMLSRGRLLSVVATTLSVPVGVPQVPHATTPARSAAASVARILAMLCISPGSSSATSFIRSPGIATSTSVRLHTLQRTVAIPSRRSASGENRCSHAQRIRRSRLGDQ